MNATLHRPLLFLGALGLCAATTTLPLLMSDTTDYSKLPPNPTVMGETLAGNKVDLPAAILTAQGATKGLAGSASMEFGNYIVNVYGEFGGKAIAVSMETGKIVSETTIAWLPGEVPTGEWNTTDSGLRYAEIVEGTGAIPDGADTNVVVHYSGWLVDGTSFDSSVDRGAPLTFYLNQVIAGWTEGVGSMRVGGKRKLIIPHQLGYGTYQKGPIPARATLIFDVELLNIL